MRVTITLDIEQSEDDSTAYPFKASDVVHGVLNATIGNTIQTALQVRRSVNEGRLRTTRMKGHPTVTIHRVAVEQTVYGIEPGGVTKTFGGA